MHIFLIGMSGIGMQGVAALCVEAGYEISGYDDGYEVNVLIEKGIKYTNIIADSVTHIVFSSAIKQDHPLMQKALMIASKKEVLIINRTDFLINHLNLNTPILVAGAHGKTTTSSMLAYLFDMKSYVLGGVVNGYKLPAHNEQGDYTSVETDESDGSFLKWKSKYKIIVNFDFEHMDYFKIEQNAIDAYRKFILEDIENTIVVIDAESKHVLESYGNKSREQLMSHPNIITFGNENANYIFHNISFEADGVRFEINGNEIYASCFGVHNVSNITAIYALLDRIGKLDLISKIAHFPGVKKRMQKIHTQDNANDFIKNFVNSDSKFDLYLDYGHHPKEVNAVLASFMLHKKKSPSVVLELHKYSRLQYTWAAWKDVLKDYEIFVLPIHSAAEKPIPEITEENFINFLTQNGVKAVFLEKFEDYIPKNDTICFSAGKLSAQLSQIE